MPSLSRFSISLPLFVFCPDDSVPHFVFSGAGFSFLIFTCYSPALLDVSPRTLPLRKPFLSSQPQTYTILSFEFRSLHRILDLFSYIRQVSLMHWKLRWNPPFPFGLSVQWIPVLRATQFFPLEFMHQFQGHPPSPQQGKLLSRFAPLSASRRWPFAVKHCFFFVGFPASVFSERWALRPEMPILFRCASSGGSSVYCP